MANDIDGHLLLGLSSLSKTYCTYKLNIGVKANSDILISTHFGNDLKNHKFQKYEM